MSSLLPAATHGDLIQVPITHSEPGSELKFLELKKGIGLLDFLSQNKIMSSKSEARRAINNNGIKINNEIVKDESKVLKISDFKNNRLKISFGKNNFKKACLATFKSEFSNEVMLGKWKKIVN